jgi:hypothetical protein
VYTGPTAVRVTREGWLRWRRRRETMRVAEGKGVLRGRLWVVTQNKCDVGVHGWEEGTRWWERGGGRAWREGGGLCGWC